MLESDDKKASYVGPYKTFFQTVSLNYVEVKYKLSGIGVPSKRRHAGFVIDSVARRAPRHLGGGQVQMAWRLGDTAILCVGTCTNSFFGRSRKASTASTTLSQALS